MEVLTATPPSAEAGTFAWHDKVIASFTLKRKRAKDFVLFLSHHPTTGESPRLYRYLATLK